MNDSLSESPKQLMPDCTRVILRKLAFRRFPIFL
jgi:hypothetical protein